MDNKTEMIMYQTEDGQTKIDVRMENETVWLSLNQIAELFQRDKSVISKHIKNVFDEGELNDNSTVAKFATVQNEGLRTVERDIVHFNLDVIISVGYRVKSLRGTQFRMWATKRLNEYIIKGFTMNDDILKKAGGGSYFDELLDRIRDIRSSEKVFWRKVLDIYATSIDYNPDTEDTKHFFQTIQNKMHWAAHGHTAAEIIMLRADSSKPFMGMTVLSEGRVRKADATVAKNYLSKEEIEMLNLVVSAYLDFAEMQVRRKIPMYMKDWITLLDDFLKLSKHEILSHKGKVSAGQALEKARFEYEKHKQKSVDELSEIEKHYVQQLEIINKSLKK
jgi:hypothetical protein